MIEFTNKIKVARVEKKMTQKQLAESLTNLGYKTSNTSIANWESGLYKPDIDTLAAICQILEKDGNYFFGYDNKEILPNTINNLELKYGNNSTKLLDYYQKLNNIGKEKAIENIKDLTEVPKYIEKKTNIQEA